MRPVRPVRPVSTVRRSWRKTHNFSLESTFWRSAACTRGLHFDFDPKIRKAPSITCILGTGETWYFKNLRPSPVSPVSPVLTSFYTLVSNVLSYYLWSMLIEDTSEFIAIKSKIVVAKFRLGWTYVTSGIQGGREVLRLGLSHRILGKRSAKMLFDIR